MPKVNDRNDSRPFWLKLKDDLRPDEAVLWLYNAFLHSAAWGTPDYEKLDEQERADFAEVIRKGELFALGENLKRVCLAHGIQLPDRVLAETSLASIKGASPLPSAQRNLLTTMHNSLYPILVRFQVKDNADTCADTSSKKFRSTPRSIGPWILARRLLEPANQRLKKKQVALDFTEGDEKKANALLKSINRHDLLNRLQKTE